MAKHKSVKPIPEGYHSITPGISVKGADRFIEFLKGAFGAKLLSRMDWPDGSVMHAEVQIGDSRLMLDEVMKDVKPMPASLYVYVDDADAVFKRALQEGAKLQMTLDDQFWGDRGGCVTDEFGNRWWILTHIEDVPLGEMQQRADEFMKKMAKT